MQSPLCKANLLKKNAPSGKITLYIGQRDYIDHYKSIDPVDGIVLVPLANSLLDQRFFVELQLHFRYRPEVDEFSDISFKKTAVVAACELRPFGNEQLQVPLNPWQESLKKKLASGAPTIGVCPFRLEFPQGSPPSFIVAHGMAGREDAGEPSGLTYKVVAYSCIDPSLPLVKRDTARFGIRVVQEPLPIYLLEQMSLAPTARPAVNVGRQFFLSPGRVQIEMSLDRAVAYYGDKVVMNVVITNSSNRTIRKIKCKLYQLSQMSISYGVRKVPIYCHETGEGCPIQPGATLRRSYQLMARVQPHRPNDNLVFESSEGRQEEGSGRLAATTLFPYTDPMEGFSIVVSYEAKVKAYMTSVSVSGVTSVSAAVPLFVFHPPTERQNGDTIIPTNTTAAKRNRMVRLTSVDQSVPDAGQQPQQQMRDQSSNLLIW